LDQEKGFASPFLHQRVGIGDDGFADLAIVDLKRRHP
jgi:hypothetical protein